MRRIAPRPPPPETVVPTSSEQEKCGGDNSVNDKEIKRRKKRSASRVFYSLEDKAKILLLIENGWKTCDIQRIVGAPESTIRNFRKNKGLLKKSVQSAKEQLASGGSTASTPVLVNKVSDRQRLISETEQLLLPWALDYLKEKGTLENSIVRKQALLFFEALSFNRGVNVSPPFTASGSWLARFKKRFGLEEEKGHSVRNKGKKPPATPTER